MIAAVALPLPSELRDADKRALDKLGYGRFLRRTGGWVAGSGIRISIDVAKRLMRLNLARIDTTGQHPQLVLTGAGRDLRGVIDQRKLDRAHRVDARSIAT